MNFWDKVTGSDMTKEMKAFESRVKKLPADYQAAWEKINSSLWPHADFTGRSLMPILDGALGLLEEVAADGQSVGEVFGGDINGFCSALAGEEGAKSYRDRWREQLNDSIAKKLGKLEDTMSIQDIIEGKKEWRAHLARVKALPQDYQIVYKEIQKYLFKTGPVELTEGTGLLSGIVDLFEEGAASGKGVLEVTGSDAAAFCDDLIKASEKQSKGKRDGKSS